MFEVLFKLLQVSVVVIHNRVTCHGMLLVVIAYPFNNYLSVIYMVVFFIFRGQKLVCQTQIGPLSRAQPKSSNKCSDFFCMEVLPM